LKTEISYGKIWDIAWPIILGSVAQNLINVTDTAFLGRVGEIALGAGAIGGIYYFTAVMLAWGFGIGLQIIVARRYGEGEFTDIGKTVEHGLYFLLPLAVLVFSIMKFLSEDLLGLIIQSADVYGETLRYIEVRSYGVFLVYINILFRGFYVGIARTRVITWTTAVLAAVNIFFDWCLIFGNLGFQEMGIEGAALASVIAEISATVFFIGYTLVRVPLAKYQLFRFARFSRELYFRVIRISLPMMLQNFISLSAWLTFFLFVEKIGESELAISNIIRSFYVVLMIPMWGFSSATNTLVSYLIGQGRREEVMSLIYKILVLCMGGVAAIVVAGFVVPEYALRIYTNDPNLIELARPVLYVVNVAALMLSGAFIFFNGVSGTGKTQVSFAIEVVVLLLYLVFNYFLVYIWQSPIEIVWMSEYLYAGLLGLLSYIYLRTGRWKGTVV
jgi:putative MATE family efflux protein